MARIKFTTSFPRDFHPDIVAAIEEYPNLCDWVHLPVQSGSDRILQAMRRGHKAAAYLEKIAAIKRARRRLALTSDIIVGFPGETEEDFRDTLRLIQKVQFDNLFTFAYSKRRGTPAAEMENQVAKAEKSERLQRLMDSEAEIAKNKNLLLLGSVQRVQAEGVSKTSPDHLSGRTNGGKLVHFKGEPSLAGQFVNVKIEESKTFALYGRIHP
jgi:tRNA-2-methylthio-N6-dimethylallyladenosine synthase